MSSHITRRVWVQNVAVGETVLRSRLDALRARRIDSPDPEADAIDSGVRNLLDKAANAAYRIDPRPRRLSNWWRGSLFEAAFQNLHAAEAEIALLYDAPTSCGPSCPRRWPGSRRGCRRTTRVAPTRNAWPPRPIRRIRTR